MLIPRPYSDLFCLFAFFLSLQFAAATAGMADCAQCCSNAQSGNARTLVKGADLPSTNGINFNARDELFVTSVVGRSITQLHPRNGRIIARLGPEHGVEAPDDLVFDSAGNLYWTAFLTGEVARMTPEGEKSTIANLGRGVNAITLSVDESKLYVSRVFLADEVWEIDLSAVVPPRLLVENIGGFNGMDIGPDGKLYGPLWHHGQVASIDTTTGIIEIVTNALVTPAAVKFNHAGELFVVDQSLGKVLHIDTQNGELRSVADVGIGVDNLAFDSRDHMYVTNTHDSVIRRVLGTSHNMNTIDSDPAHCSIGDIYWGCVRTKLDYLPGLHRVSMITHGGLTTSSGVAVHNKNGRASLFVSDIYSIREYSPLNGHPRSVAHSIVGGITELNTPFSLSSYGSYLLISSWFSNVVQIWDPDLQEVVDEYRDFAVPLNAIGFGDGLAVAELGSGCVMQQTTDRSNRIALACDLKVPAGLAQQDGKLFVSDWETGSVWQITTNYKAIEPPLQIARGLQKPEGMAVTDKGRLLVVETGADRLLEIDPSSGATIILADELPLGNNATPGYPPTWILNSVAVDDCGALYLNVDGDRSVRRIADNGVLRCELSRHTDTSSY